MIFLLFMSFFFMFVKQKCNFFEREKRWIFSWFLCEFPMNLTDFFATRIRFTKRIREAEMKRIRNNAIKSFSKLLGFFGHLSGKYTRKGSF